MTPDSARTLVRAIQNLHQDLNLGAGQPGLATFQSAVGVVDALATTTHTTARLVSLVAEYVRAECEAERVRPGHEFPDADVTLAKGTAFLAARSAIPALEHAAKTLTAMHDAMAPLESTTAPLRDAADTTPTRHQLRTHAAMNMVLALLLDDTETFRHLLSTLGPDDSFWLGQKLGTAVRISRGEDA